MEQVPTYHLHKSLGQLRQLCAKYDLTESAILTEVKVAHSGSGSWFLASSREWTERSEPENVKTKWLESNLG